MMSSTVTTPLRRRKRECSQTLQLVAEAVVEVGTFIRLLDRCRGEVLDLRDRLAERLRAEEGENHG